MFYGHKLVKKELKSSPTAIDVIYQKMFYNNENVDKKNQRSSFNSS